MPVGAASVCPVITATATSSPGTNPPPSIVWNTGTLTPGARAAGSGRDLRRLAAMMSVNVVPSAPRDLDPCRYRLAVRGPVDDLPEGGSPPRRRERFRMQRASSTVTATVPSLLHVEHDERDGYRYGVRLGFPHAAR